MVKRLLFTMATCAKFCGRAHGNYAIKGRMMRISIACFTLALLICLNEATFAADAYNGSRLAERWCMSCHIVSSTQSGGIDGTLSFASIAQKADFSAEKLTFFLLDPHPTMPNMSLSRNEAQDLAAYIAQQRR